MPYFQRELPLSLQFYLKAVNLDLHKNTRKMIKNGIGRDKRPYYRKFSEKLLDESN